METKIPLEYILLIYYTFSEDIAIYVSSRHFTIFVLITFTSLFRFLPAFYPLTGTTSLIRNLLLYYAKIFHNNLKEMHILHHGITFQILCLSDNLTKEEIKLFCISIYTHRLRSVLTLTRFKRLWASLTSFRLALALTDHNDHNDVIIDVITFAYNRLFHRDEAAKAWALSFQTERCKRSNGNVDMWFL